MGSYKGNPNNDSALVGFLNQSNGSAIDIRINSNKEGIHDYQVLHSPSQQENQLNGKDK